MPDFVTRDEFQNLHNDVREVRTDVRELPDQFARSLEAAIRPLTDQVRKQNGRVSKLERWIWGVAGGGAALMWLADKLWR